MIFALLTLLAALGLAAVSGWFSIIGIMSIYAGAAFHALVMGIVLESGKLVTTSWLYRNWDHASWKLKTPLIFFTITLMLATSIGVFGFLSKAHLEQGAGTVDNAAKVERLDQQIAREKSTIDDDNKVIAQLDSTINSYLGKDRTDRSVSVRKNQAPQRKQLKDDIDASQKRIDQYSDEKLKLQSEVRKLQLDVGPIRYIAELIYGADGNTDKSIESAVRIFTLIIVSTLDPLAVILLIAANHTLLRIKNEKEVKILSEETKFREQIEDVDNGSSSDKIGIEDFKEDSESTSEIVPNNDEEISIIRSEDINAIKDEAIPVEILPEAVDVNEIKDTLSEEVKIFSANEEISDDKFPDETSSAGLESESINIHNNAGEESETLSINKQEIEILPLQIITQNVSAPIGVRSPSLTRISRYFSEAQPSSAHFVPQRVNEENENNTLENSTPTIKGEEGLAAVLTTRPIARIEETIQQESVATTSEEITDETVVQDRNTSETKKDYPKTLSWLNEFKRT